MSETFDTDAVRIGRSAPQFAAESTHGPIHFPADYRGHWVILFSYPEDFSPISTSELMMFESLRETFDDLNVRLLGISTDGLLSHIAWLRAIRKSVVFRDMKDVRISYPLIDDSSRRVASLYGLVLEGEDLSQTVRSTFIIDPAGVIRTMIFHPRGIGRNVDELVRVVTALKTAAEFGVATPADWYPGEDVLIQPKIGVSGEAVLDETHADWFFQTRFISTADIRAAITVSGLTSQPAPSTD